MARNQEKANVRIRATRALPFDSPRLRCARAARRTQSVEAAEFFATCID